MSNFFEAGKAAMTSNKDDWETPQALFDELDRTFHFGLDAASTDANAKCDAHFTSEEDGLAQDWSGYGAVWCNPPYGRVSPKWIEKMAKEAAGGVPIVALLPARTDTRAFHEYIYEKPNVRIEFIRGRLKFEVDGIPRQSAPFPSMLVYFNC